jgi:2'-5' RNA ligase
MFYLVIAYPKIEDKDLAWIQEYRKENDLRFFSVVNPHITFVFPTQGISQDDFTNEIKKQAEDIRKIDFEIKLATINKDSFGGYYHEFLVPEKGYSDIVKLHDKLYSNKLSEHLRFDIDFIPHIGIGNSDDPHISKNRIISINAQNISILGTIDQLDVVEYDNGVIKTIEKILLD